MGISVSVFPYDYLISLSFSFLSLSHKKAVVVMIFPQQWDPTMGVAKNPPTYTYTPTHTQTQRMRFPWSVAISEYLRHEKTKVISTY